MVYSEDREYTCTNHDHDFCGLSDIIEHIRKVHTSFIRRPGRPGHVDSHGHMWYCFECDRLPYQDHRSYDSDRAMLDHLKDRHSELLEHIYAGDEELMFKVGW